MWSVSSVLVAANNPPPSYITYGFTYKIIPIICISAHNNYLCLINYVSTVLPYKTFYNYHIKFECHIVNAQRNDKSRARDAKTKFLLR